MLNKLNKLFYRLDHVKNIYDLNRDMQRIWEVENELLFSRISGNSHNSENNKLRKYLMLIDLKEYLTDDLICKMERASMDNSIELRMPFLDRKLVRYSLSLPLNIINKDNKPKYVLKNPRKIFTL